MHANNNGSGMRRHNRLNNALIAASVAAFFIFGVRKVWSMPVSGLKYKTLFNDAERKHNLPPKILMRIAQQESAFRDDIITGQTTSAAGAQGIMQIVPKWHQNVDPLNVAEAIDYAGGYLRSLYDRFGDWQLALAAYNWGQGNLAKWLRSEAAMPAETKNYVKQISEDLNL